MTHKSSHIIVSSVAPDDGDCAELPRAAHKGLSKLVGNCGANVAEVARHIICEHFSVAPNED